MSTLSLNVRSAPDGTALISPTGEIDADNAHELREAVNALLVTATPRTIKVDMLNVSFIDSVGIGALVACYHTAAASKVRLVVTNPTANVHRVLYASGLLGLFGSPARPPDQPRPKDALPADR